MRKARLWCALAAAVLTPVTSVFGQKVFFENFDALALGPNVEEASKADHVWTKTAPAGWVIDDSLMPGYGTTNYPANDGRREWAGWSFADVKWWPTVDNQRRAEFVLASGAAAIADPDEWDDDTHIPGLFNSLLTTPSFSVAGKEANSLVITFDSSWRPEAHDDGLPKFPVNEEGNPTNNQTAVVTVQFDDGTETQVMYWSSVSDDAEYHDHNPNESIVLPLNNPAGASVAKLKFGLLYAANDWWWAFDNLAVGEPPLLTGVTATGVGFTIRITEALGKTVDTDAGITAKLDGQSVTVTSIREGDVVLVNGDLSPKIFVPGSKHTVELTYKTSAGKTIVDSAEFVAPTYCSASSTPLVLTAVISEKDYLTVDESKGVKFQLDGTVLSNVTATRTEIADAPDTISAVHTSATPFASGSTHSLTITFTTTTAQQVVETVTFTAPTFVTIPAELGTATGTGAQPGMKWRIHQLEARSASTVAAAEDQLAGKLGASIHDPSSEVAGGYFEINYVNFEKDAADAGNFNGSAEGELAVWDEIIPGIPGTTGITDYYAAEALAFVEFPQAGHYTMVVNSDDGFQVSIGNTNNPAYLVLGKYDSTRSPSDTQFHFGIDTPGVYLFRLMQYNGTGGAGVEWFTVQADGTRALVGGTQTGALKAYRARTVAEPALPSATPPRITALTRNPGGTLTLEWTGGGTLQAAPTLTGPWTDVTGATSPYTLNSAESAMFGRIKR